MRRFLIALGIAAVCALIAFIFFWYYMSKTNLTPAPTTLSDFPGYQVARVEIDGVSINAAVADTQPLQELGLGNRAGLASDEGMLFIFPTDGEYAFWMKDMSFSIDMIWISANGNIVYMAQNVSPQTYPENFVPTSPARYVLELPAGFAQAHHFKVGDAAHL